jgi:chromosome segregation ATPase
MANIPNAIETTATENHHTVLSGITTSQITVPREDGISDITLPNKVNNGSSDPSGSDDPVRSDTEIISNSESYEPNSLSSGNSFEQSPQSSIEYDPFKIVLQNDTALVHTEMIDVPIIQKDNQTIFVLLTFPTQTIIKSINGITSDGSNTQIEHQVASPYGVTVGSKFNNQTKFPPGDYCLGLVFRSNEEAAKVISIRISIILEPVSNLMLSQMIFGLYRSLGFEPSHVLKYPTQSHNAGTPFYRKTRVEVGKVMETITQLSNRIGEHSTQVCTKISELPVHKLAEISSMITNNTALLNLVDLKTTQLGSQLTQVDSKTTQLGSQLTQVDSKTTQLESQLTQVDSKTTQLGSQLGEINSKTAQLGSQLGSQLAQVDSKTTQLGSQLGEIDSKTAQLGSQLTQVESKTAQLGSQLTQVESKTAQLGSQLGEIESKTAQLGSQLGEIDSKTAQLGSQLTQVDSKTTQLGSQLTQVDSKTTQLGSQLGEIDSKTTQLGSQLGEIDSKTTQLGSQLTQVDSRVSNIGVVATEVISKVCTLCKSTAQISSKSDESNHEVSNRIAELGVRVDKVSEIINPLVTVQEKLKEICQSMGGMAASGEVSKQLQEVQSQIQRIHEQLARNNGDIEKGEHETQSIIVSDFEKLIEEKELYLNKLGEAEDHIEYLQEQIEEMEKSRQQTSLDKFHKPNFVRRNHQDTQRRNLGRSRHDQEW